MSWLNGGIANLAEEICESYTPDEKEDFPYIGLEHVEPQSLRLCSIGSSLDVKSQKWRFRRGDILFGTLRPYFRKVIRANCDGVCSTEFSVIRPKMNEDSEFIFYFVSHPEFIEYATTNSKGDRPRTKWELFSKYSASIPPLHIRKRLGSILGNYDDLIANNYRRISLLEESARLLYKEWFVRLRFPGHEHTRLVNGIPEGWERVGIPQIIEIDPKTYVPKEGEKWFVEMADLSFNSMVILNMKKRSGNSGSKFQNGDTLFARITPCLENGKTGFVNFLEEGETAFGSTEFIVLRPKRVSAEFVYCLARTYDFRENAIKSMIGSSGRQRVQVSCLNEFSIPLAPPKLLEKFKEFAVHCFNQIRVLSLQNQRLKQARDLLLPRLMSGEITV